MGKCKVEEIFGLDVWNFFYCDGIELDGDVEMKEDDSKVDEMFKEMIY